MAHIAPEAAIRRRDICTVPPCRYLSSNSLTKSRCSMDREHCDRLGIKVGDIVLHPKLPALR
jgi:hypothetical protein